MFSPVTEKHMKAVFERYFCPKTELLYEFVVDETGNAWHHLPSVEEINAAVPNPCGWGTGMEDSVMNGGNAIDMLITVYELTKDVRIKPCVDSLFRGLLRCADGKKNKGFVARSISPFDGESHYIESSRDQYTHWIYAALHLYNSPLADDGQREQIRKVLAAIAQKCERDVLPENDFHMLREDGTVGRVNKMWGDVGTHEWLRLPMFYLAAFCVTKDPHWEKLYLQYRDEAVARSLMHDPSKMRCYASLQMQCALRLIYDYDEDPAVREKMRQLMLRNAAFGAEKAVENSAACCDPKQNEVIHYRFRPWNGIEPFHQGVFGGYNYDNPAQSERRDVNPAFYPVREVAEGAIMAAMCPMFSVTSELSSAVDAMAERIDLKRFSSIYAPLLLSEAHILCTARMKQDE